MKQVLYSPGYGAGWSSWAHSGAEQFSAEYLPIIQFLNEGGQFIETKRGNGAVPEEYEEPGASVLKKFLEDLRAHTNNSEFYFFFGGASQLRVGTVRNEYVITERDGHERLEDKEIPYSY